jgi:hypothetical protein
MAENIEASSGTTDAAHATTEIAYCPNLGLYHYIRADGTHFIFDREQLETAVESYLKQGDQRQAEFMIGLVGHARRYPHVFVVLFADGTYALRRMEIPDDEPESGIVEDSSSSAAGLKEKKTLETAARDLLSVAQNSLPPDGKDRVKWETAISAMETLLGSSTG